jgi:hypothetical protein
METEVPKVGHLLSYWLGLASRNYAKRKSRNYLDRVEQSAGPGALLMGGTVGINSWQSPKGLNKAILPVRFTSL